MQRVGDCSGRTQNPSDSLVGYILEWGFEMVRKPNQECVVRLEVLNLALNQAAQESTPLEGYLQQLRELVLGEMEEIFYRRLTGDVPAKVTPMRVIP